jgi:hypothetical protein
MDRAWKPDSGRGPRPGLASTGIYDTMIEVIDPRTSRVVASARVDRLMRLTPDGMLAYAMEETADGNLIIATYELKLTGFSSTSDRSTRFDP